MSSASIVSGGVLARSAPLDAQTTPFVQPSFCADLFSTTTVSEFPVRETGTTSYGYSNRVVTALVPDGNDPRFTSCLPDGWAAKPSQYQYTFSPAVCPSGWIAHAIGPYWERDGVASTTSMGSSSGQQASTAYCCPSLHSLDLRTGTSSISGLSTIIFPACIRGMDLSSPVSTSTESDATTQTPTGSTTLAGRTAKSITTRADYLSGIQVQNAWHIKWKPSDTSTLSPVPPTLICGSPLDTWIPGQSVPTQTEQCPGYRTSEPAENGDPAMQNLPVIVGVTVGVVGFLILVCIGLCMLRRKRKPRRPPPYQRTSQANQGAGSTY
ncbi:hypothetical protein CONLIGDRAFT_687461 [Coniochaeta ligniaria NRRL 30616]|uniref:Uncharacterized protein n=1 Tax=Coniochaeta ligniaria NRRL 30616 TaxID=1408157 RepID=A0A1J7J0H2_9PEZI|nr:hypothetical protein CONLIGDRAFT_687461 [Coniochaeta ligniaria NRRL 30616]